MKRRKRRARYNVNARTLDYFMDITFAILGLVFGIMGFAVAVVCMVKMQRMQKMLKEKGIAQ